MISLLSQTLSHYRILNQLGENLIGEVYIAEDTQLGRKVVLQILPEKFTQDAERMSRLTREARTLSTLNHPNIRMIYEVGSGDAQGATRHFIATEFVDGPNLRIHLSRRRFKLEEILDVVTQTAAGLAAAHAAGVLHRDLQPENIVLRADGYVKIIDFGLAKLLEQDSVMIALGGASGLTEEAPSDTVTAPMDEAEFPGGEDARAEGGPSGRTHRDPYGTKPLDPTFRARLEAAGGEDRPGSLWGPPGAAGYLSPEQIRGEPIDERSDIFSLGVVAFEMCAGRLPFEDIKDADPMSSISQPPPLGEFMPDAPEELEWIVAKALATERDERYQTAREMISDLKRLKQRLDFETERERLERRDSSQPGRRSRGSGSRPAPPLSPAPRRNSQPGSPDPSAPSGRSGFPSRSGRSGEVGGDSGGLLSRSSASRLLAGPIDSVAIMPLANAGQDPAVEYLSDGITESIINALSRLPRVRVMARATVFRYKGHEIDPLEIGAELNVRAVFTGRLAQRGDTLVIKAELVDTTDGSLLWAEQYTRKSGDILALEDEIAQQISEHLKVKFSSEQRQGLAKHYTENAEAYELYLRGRYFWNQRSLTGMKKGIEYFVQAIRRDARYALAYAGMADCYMMLSVYQLPPREFVPKARMLITRALEADDLLAEAHASFGSLSFWYDWDLVKAEEEYRRAIELNANLPEPYQWLAYLYAAQGRFDDAFASLRQAQRLDPLSIVITTNTAEILYRARRFDDALAHCEKALDLDPQFAKARYWRVMAWIAGGRLGEAVVDLEPAMSAPDEVRAIASVMLAVAFARGGNRDKAQIIYERLRQYAVNNYFPPFYLALMAANLGETDQAFEWLDKAYQERSGWMPWLNHEPLLDSLNRDSRFSDLLRRVGVGS
jgi:serine/threonine protein kinase/tetratricopeptide (TPR) repeat protein